MKYSKKDLMNEGWASMETLLDKEMPANKKDYNYALIALFVLFAFSIGIWTGTQISTDKNTAEAIKQNLDNKSSQEVSMLQVSPKATSTIKTSESANVAESNQSLVKDELKNLVDDRGQQNKFNISPGIEQGEVITHSISNETINHTALNEVTAYQTSFVENTVNSTIAENKAGSEFNLVNLIPFKEINSEGIPTSYLPRSNDKIKNNTNRVLGLGLSTGVNVDRNTKVLSLKSDWMYKIGKQNSVGVQFLYAAEDEFGFFPMHEDPVKPTTNRPGTEESEGRSSTKEFKQNSRQYRFASGLVIQQEIGYRFYTDFAFGIDMLQNSYSEDIQLKSLNNTKDIQYHFGGYTSVSLGYRISKLVDLEISGTKSMLIEGTGVYKPGNSDHLVGGVKISF